MNGIRFAVRLTPRGGRDAIDGWVQDSAGKKYLKARVSLPPEDGKANKALIALLAKALDIPKSSIRIAAGGTSRLKTIQIDGDRAALGAKLSEL
ncbi:MAG: DUF167 domain-containing protein [Proteobacteria bacterium]|nr:DUF167 domain-containing protein [Pseudomonadota bacterium]